MNAFSFPAPPRCPRAVALRLQVRNLLATALASRGAIGKAGSRTGMDAEFSRKMGLRGWIGMTLPKPYGGDPARHHRPPAGASEAYPRRALSVRTIE